MKPNLIGTAATALLLALSALVPSSAQAQEITFKDQKAFEEAVRDYLMSNPGVIMDAINEFQRIQTISNKMPRIDVYRGFLEDGVRHAALGNPKGEITVLEFFDYRCHYCRKHFADVQKMLAENPNVRLVPIPFPILDRENKKPNSRLTALAGLAAHKQGKFKEFHIAMMTLSEKPTEDDAYRVAAQLGLDVDQLKKDMKSKSVEKHLAGLLSIGQDIGWRGTPAYVIGNDIVEGAQGIQRMREAVTRANTQLAGKKSANGR